MCHLILYRIYCYLVGKTENLTKLWTLQNCWKALYPSKCLALSDCKVIQVSIPSYCCRYTLDSRVCRYNLVILKVVTKPANIPGVCTRRKNSFDKITLSRWKSGSRRDGWLRSSLYDRPSQWSCSRRSFDCSKQVVSVLLLQDTTKNLTAGHNKDRWRRLKRKTYVSCRLPANK